MHAGVPSAQGAHPSVVDVAARYPTFIPHHAAGGPFVQLQAASVAQVRTVFMGIEQPEPTHAPPQGDHFATIGQLYEAIAEGIRDQKALTAAPEAELVTRAQQAQQQEQALQKSAPSPTAPTEEPAPAD